MKNIGRPRKKKVIHRVPSIDYFSPRGRLGRPDELIITLEEYEAIRLHDLLGMRQKHAAEMMHISQQSFSRLVRESRKKIADALVNAKILRIEGGDFINKRAHSVIKKLKRK